MARAEGESHSIAWLDARISRWTTFSSVVAGAALGVAPDLLIGGSQDTGFDRRLVLMLTALALGGVAWGRAARLRRRRRLLWEERGTLYVVDSPMSSWRLENKKMQYLSEQSKEFAEVLKVPGPTALYQWGWPVDDRAILWEGALDDLILSFLSVMENDDVSTPNSVITWAPWPVALSWAARVRASRRDLVLSIRERRSTGRIPVDVDSWAREVHTFMGVPAPLAHASDPEVRAGRPAVLEFAGGGSAGLTGDAGPFRVLLVRTSAAEWEGLSLDEPVGPAIIRVSVPSGLPWSGTVEADLLEWRCLPRPGREHHAWEDFPALADQIVRWVADNASTTGVTFLGTAMPQEVGVGMGIVAQQREQGRWPEHLWPLVKPEKDARLIVPGLDLGFGSLHAVHVATRREAAP